MDSLPASRLAESNPQYLPNLTATPACCPNGFAMVNETPSQETTFGYLSVINSEEYGYFGGYLIVGPRGRPLEFHCTAPVRPSRAQQILYGPTLEPFLLGEQIAGAMLDAAKLQPSLILTNCDATLHARSRIRSPMVLLCGNVNTSGDSIGTNHASIGPTLRTSSSSGPHETVSVGAFELAFPIGFESDRDQATRLLADLVCQIDLAEPFGRIEEAIREAQRLGGTGTVSHDQAA
jgi:hypothetical protein